ncbi:hypothetical protein DMUE_0101 [Dictyocoela muelleri]|nr:hypothetical protein DMUE_0101 [Dictyocoela muelleri]
MFTLIPLIVALIEPLKKEDLFSKNEFLIYVYYEREDFKCPLCKTVQKYLEKINYPIKTINFYENPRLGSCFMTVFFPVIYLKGNDVFFKLNTVDIEDIERIVKEFDLRYLHKLNYFKDPRSFLVYVSSYFFHIFIFYLRYSEYISKNIPVWAFTLIIGGLFYLLFLSIAKLISIKD